MDQPVTHEINKQLPLMHPTRQRMKAEKPTSHHSDSTDVERAHARDYERLGRVEHWSQQESEDTEGAKHRHDRRRWKRDFSYRMSPNCKQFGREKLEP